MRVITSYIKMNFLKQKHMQNEGKTGDEHSKMYFENIFQKKLNEKLVKDRWACLLYVRKRHESNMDPALQALNTYLNSPVAPA